MFAIGSGQPFAASQLTAASPAGTARQTVPVGCARRWMSFRTWAFCGSIRDRIPPRETRLCVFALKSAHPAGVVPGLSSRFAAVSIAYSDCGLAWYVETRETGVSVL